MMPEARAVHTTIRRLRVKIPSKKGDGPYFSQIEDRLADCPGIDSVEVNPLTGSTLILHHTNAATIADYATRNDLFRFRPWKGPRKTLFETVEDILEDVNRRLKRVTGGEFDIPSLFFAVLLISGGYQIARGNLGAPAWYTAFWYAFGIFSRDVMRDVGEPESIEDVPEADTY
jgi:hypothetical protein